MATFATLGDSTSGGDAGFDPCAIAMYGSLEVVDLALAGDLERDGLPELLVLGYPPASAALVAQAIALDQAQPEPGPNGGVLAERVVQEVRFGPGFVSPNETRVAGLGDIDGDGFVDLGVAAFVEDPAGERVRTFVLFGEAVPAATRELRVDGGDGRVWVIEAPLAELAFDEVDQWERILLGRIDDMTGDGRDELHVHPANGRMSWVVFGTGAPNSTLVLDDLAAKGAGFRIIQPGDPTLRAPLFALPTSVPHLDQDEYGDLVVSHFRAVEDHASTSGDAVGRFGGPYQPDLDLNDLDGQDWTVHVGPSRSYVFSIGPIPEDRDDQPTELWLAGPQVGAFPFRDAGCQADVGPPSMFRLVANPTTQGRLEELVQSGDAVPALLTDCPLGNRLASGSDWNGDGTPDLAIASVEAGFSWFDGRDLGVDRLPLSLSSRNWEARFCVGTDGVERVAAYGAHATILGTPDLDGDGLGEVVVAMIRYPSHGNPSARIAVFPGRLDGADAVH
ncbi:MAG: hypothetical protein K1X88_13245 [Nannocystaceae bacterium]|nr:hypothetical protein [Nannocystaceae bacterium]